jgi:uncharacterized protein (TIGR03000 family)
VVVNGCYGCSGCYGSAAAPPRPAATPRIDPNLIPRNAAERDAIRDALKRLREKKKEEVRASPRPARVTVQLPADATLYIDNEVCPLTSATRTFPTPALQPGREYYYTLRAEVVRDGQTLVQRQRVTVSAGRQVSVRLNDFSPVRTAQR